MAPRPVQILGAASPAAALRVNSPFGWFAGSLALWSGAAGMQQVLFSWLVIGELRATPQWVGAAQMFQSLPALLFLLVGGATADRRDRRRMLLVLHVAAAAAAGAMGFVVAAGALGMGVLILYGLGWGTTQAFAQPARDALISDVAGADLMRAITAATLIQFAAAAVGSRLAGWVAHLGTPVGLAVQAAVVLLGFALLLRLPPAPPHPASRGRVGTIAAIRAGLREVWRSERLLPIALLVAADGLFFMGPFAVLCPLIIRDVYHGGVDDLSRVMMTLPLGTIAGSLVVLLRRGIRRKGRVFLIALLGVALCLVALYAQPPLWGFMLIIFAWGVFHSLFFNTSRTLFQAAAPASHRARVLSIHALGLLGMAPISNLAAGFLGRLVGPTAACALAGSAMVLIVCTAWVRTAVRHLE
jgi:MFS family permease